MHQSGTNQMSILVTGIVRDISETIEKDIQVIQNALQNFREIHWFLVESNSQDQSVAALQNLSMNKPNFSYVSLGRAQDTIGSRTIGMALARNRYLTEIRNNATYTAIDLVAVADFNGLNDKLKAEGIESCFMRSDWDACFANQSGRYYDIWALRHPLWSPNDCWQQLDFYRQFKKFPERALRISLGNRMIKIPSKGDWIEVDSAFGGFGIYRRNALDEGNYSGVETNGVPICEHVPFHAGLRRNGKKLFINPSLINTKSTDHSQRMNLFHTFIRLLKYPSKMVKKSSDDF